MTLSSYRIAAVLFAAIVAFPVVASADAHSEASDSAYPIQIFDRPFTLPKGAWQAGLDLDANEGFDFINAGVIGSYGLMDLLQLDLAYSWALKDAAGDFEAKGPLTVGASYVYYEAGPMTGMAVAAVGYDFLAEGLSPLEVGSLLWYAFTDKMALYTVPTLNVFLEEIDGLGNPIFLTVPIIFAIQATPNVYAEVGTEVATIEIADSDSLFFGADYIPLEVVGFFSPNNMLDIGAGVVWGDLKEESDSLTFLVLARYRGGL